MLFSTPTQYCVLVLLLIAGWFFGLASSNAGRRWQERYAAERDAHAVTRRDLDARRIDADGRVTAANQRISALEAENDRLRTSVPVATPPVAATPLVTPVVTPARAPATMPPISRTAATPTYPDGTPRGWFDWRR